MALRIFELKELDQLDGGRVAVAFAQALARVVADLEDRPGELTARKITLQMEVIPVVDEHGKCAGMKSSFQIKDSIPTRKSKTYDFGLDPSGRMYYSDESPGNVAQYTFDDVDPETGRVKRPLPDEETSDAS